MKPITIAADDELAYELQERADREGRSVESLAADLLRRQLQPSPGPAVRYSFVGIAHSTKGDLSGRVDELLAEGAESRALT